MEPDARPLCRRRASEEEDEDFDFEEALRSIHIDLQGAKRGGGGIGGTDHPELRGVEGVIPRARRHWPTVQFKEVVAHSAFSGPDSVATSTLKWETWQRFVRLT